MKTSYDDGYKQAQADITFEKDLYGDDIGEVVKRLALNYAFGLKGFYFHGGKDYKVIVTRFDRGYMAALKEMEE